MNDTKTYIIKTTESIHYIKASRFICDEHGIWMFDKDEKVGFFPLQKLLSVEVKDSIVKNE